MNGLGVVGIRLLGILMVGGCLLGMLVGCWLLIRPDSGQSLRRPVGDLFRPLTRPIRTERFFYRHHRFFGGFVFFTSAVFLLRLKGFLGQELVLTPLAGPGGPVQIWIWESLVLFFCLAGLFTFIVGVLLLVRPSLLRSFESWANQHFSTDGLRTVAARWRDLFLAWVLEHPRVIALLLITGSLFTLRHFLQFRLTFLLGF
ncbi:MAG: hypothetical protein HQL64_02035 [Magnetococcales bacterium]|nr:hypothetical protein [Magnetococcales bacterium]